MLNLSIHRLRLDVFSVDFHISTGPQYWQLLYRARAVEKQLFVAAISPARNELASYVDSMIIDPMENILTQASISEEIILHGIRLMMESTNLLPNE